MRTEVHDQYQAFPDPSPEVVPIAPDQLDRIDDSLHYGWSWHRYRYCYRKAVDLKILDAGCGTGLTTLGLARLNPTSRVLGVDASPRSLELARNRAEVSPDLHVEFREHDLGAPIGSGPFDFIVCRHVLGQTQDPNRVLAQLARELDRRGLLYITIPSRTGRTPARQLRRAVSTLSPPGSTLAERAEIGREILTALRPDHMIRQFEARFSGTNMPGVERIVAGYLGVAERDWDLEEAIVALERAGLKFLYAATNRAWQANLVFGSSIPEELKTRVSGLSERDQAILIDALDATLHADEYRIYACPADYEPRVPAWLEDRNAQPEVFDRLIPHRTGLADPTTLTPDPAASRGRVTYRAVSGAAGELDRPSDLAFRAIDGRRSVGEIDRELAPSPLSETVETRHGRWLDLANHGFIVLESPDPRQNIDCIHLGSIRDRLDCPCPRRWVRACERHELCTIDEIKPGDPQVPALEDALQRLSRSRVVSCARCADYQPDE
jgi:SAM-dependent methyltransferase